MDALARLLVSWFPLLSRHLMPSLLALRHFATIEDAHYRCCVNAALEEVGMNSRGVRRRLHELPYHFRAEQHFFEHADIDALRRTRLIIRNGDTVRAAIRARGNCGLIFGCANFAPLHYSIAALTGLVDDVLVLSDEPTAHVERICRKAGELAGIEVHAVKADAFAGLPVLRQLKHRGAIVAMLDSYHGGESGFVESFMGKPAAGSEGLYALAARCGALVVPSALFRVRGGFEMEVGAPINAGTAGIEATCRDVHAFYETCVRAHPDQWMSWPNLLVRWELAAASAAPFAKQGML